ncbi:methionyl-tRNA formyltransferase [Formosa maritima]|uniref:Methionyl-tRNA formyltransferase n=1 Tax=Formosa maritima TaxID=2592046 RepID=A0A5D0G5L8_9FLAO|nr:methionyl-tRNA formyltransferase [Formosa maritima]TYA54363.1 methionyl-tRNA formyltransferase [Formosa maritima]
MKDLRIVFMGTPDFAVSILKTLVENHYQIVGVITAPDKPAGRGRKLNESAVKVYAKSQGLHVMQPTNLKNEDFVNELRNLRANLQIVVAFRMLPQVVWQLPEYGTFNLHASSLPDYRGAAPINWAIINGETKTGVTTFFIDEKIDTGEIILQSTVDIDPKEDAGSLHDKLMYAGSELVLETVKLIETNQVHTTVQPKEETKTAYKLDRNNCKIDWNDSLEQIYNKIRGLSPYPAAWSYLQNGDDQLEVKIYETTIEKELHHFPIGHLITTKKELKVAVTNGFINIKELKLPGKRKMDSKSLLNGYSFHELAKML